MDRVQPERIAPPSRAHGASPPFQGTALDIASRVGNARFHLSAGPCASARNLWTSVEDRRRRLRAPAQADDQLACVRDHPSGQADQMEAQRLHACKIACNNDPLKGCFRVQ